MKSRKFVAANWKMNKTIPQSEEFISDFICKNRKFNCDVLICPTCLSIPVIVNKCHSAGLYVGAQNCHWENSGAFTGEISAPMLSDIGVDYVILGHSERRTYFAETDEMISKKVDNALKSHLKVILCVGETKDQQERGEMSCAVIGQVNAALSNVAADELKNIIVAYEPVWAIGTGKIITPFDADKICGDIRGVVTSKYGNEYAQNLLVIYGGSVNSTNAKIFLDTPGIDGALVGGASLEVEEFFKIVSIAENI